MKGYVLRTENWKSSKFQNVFFSETLWGKHTSLESHFPSPRQWCIFLTLAVSVLAPTWWDMASWTFKMFSCKYGGRLYSYTLEIKPRCTVSCLDRKPYCEASWRDFGDSEDGILPLSLHVLSWKHLISFGECVSTLLPDADSHIWPSWIHG